MWDSCSFWLTRNADNSSLEVRSIFFFNGLSRSRVETSFHETFSGQIKSYCPRIHVCRRCHDYESIDGGCQKYTPWLMSGVGGLFVEFL